MLSREHEAYTKEPLQTLRTFILISSRRNSVSITTSNGRWRPRSRTSYPILCYWRRNAAWHGGPAWGPGEFPMQIPHIPSRFSSFTSIPDSPELFIFPFGPLPSLRATYQSLSYAQAASHGGVTAAGLPSNPPLHGCFNCLIPCRRPQSFPFEEPQFFA